MLKRLLLSSFIAVVVCGISFYLAYFLGLMYTAASGPLNPANTEFLQAALRRIALPVSIGLGLVVFILAFRGLSRREANKAAAKVVGIR